MADTDNERTIQPGDALIVVDVQNDFCEGGALAVSGGNDVVPVLNRWIEEARRAGAAVVASRDWHPQGHCSFTDQGGPWPVHCVQETDGAAFHPELALPEDAMIVTKGDHQEFDQYSAFDRTGLGDELRSRGVQRVWIGGLAQDVCVKATALDAVKEGFGTRVLLDATRPVNPEDGERANEQMRNAGVVLTPAGPT